MGRLARAISGLPSGEPLNSGVPNLPDCRRDPVIAREADNRERRRQRHWDKYHADSEETSSQIL
jgi:hypothetical protein